MSGRRPKPATSKSLSDDQHRKAAIVHVPAEAPPMPEYFKDDPALSRVWIEVVTDLDRMNRLTLTDSGTVEAYCICLNDMRNLQTMLTRDGLTYEAKTKTGTRHLQNPCVKMRNDAIKQLKTLAQEMGCTPASRGRVPSGLQADLFGGKNGQNSWNTFQN